MDDQILNKLEELTNKVDKELINTEKEGARLAEEEKILSYDIESLTKKLDDLKY
jgi:hypothetical protein